MPTPASMPRPGGMPTGMPTPASMPRPGGMPTGMPTPASMPRPGGMPGGMPTPASMPRPAAQLTFQPAVQLTFQPAVQPAFSIVNGPQVEQSAYQPAYQQAYHPTPQSTVGSAQLQLVPPFEGRPVDESRFPLPKIPTNYQHKEVSGTKGKTYSQFSYDEAKEALIGSLNRGQGDEASQWACELFWKGPQGREDVWNTLLMYCLMFVSPREREILIRTYLSSIDQQSKTDIYSVLTLVKTIAQVEKSCVVFFLLDLYPTLKNNQSARTFGTLDQMSQMLQNSIENFSPETSLTEAIKVETVMSYSGMSNSVNLIWSVFYRIYGHDHIFIKMLKNMTESKWWENNGIYRAAHVYMILQHLYGTIPDNLNIGSSTNISEQDVDQAVQNCWNRTYLYGVPDYAVNLHTKRGKELGRTIEQYYLSVSRQTPQCEKYKDMSRWAYEQGIGTTHQYESLYTEC